MFLIGLIIGFLLGVICVGTIGIAALLFSHRDCGKDWWKDDV